jgi:hypothetical protein
METVNPRTHRLIGWLIDLNDNLRRYIECLSQLACTLSHWVITYESVWKFIRYFWHKIEQALLQCLRSIKSSWKQIHFRAGVGWAIQRLKNREIDVCRNMIAPLIDSFFECAEETYSRKYLPVFSDIQHIASLSKLNKRRSNNDYPIKLIRSYTVQPAHARQWSVGDTGEWSTILPPVISY